MVEVEVDLCAIDESVIGNAKGPTGPKADAREAKESEIGISKLQLDSDSKLS
jgi:hypothetical protein